MRAAVLISVGVLTLVACDEPRTPTAPTSAQAPAPPTPPPPLGPPPVGNSNSERYVMTLSIGSSCTVIPESERTRTYSATIEKRNSGPAIVTLDDGRFLSGPICTAGSGRFSGVGCNQFFASEEGNTVEFGMDNNNDEAHGGHIVEQLPSGGWWELTGSALGTRTADSINASGTVDVWYCPSPLVYPFPCFAFTGCRAVEMRMQFTRR